MRAGLPAACDPQRLRCSEGAIAVAAAAAKAAAAASRIARVAREAVAAGRGAAKAAAAAAAAAHAPAKHLRKQQLLLAHRKAAAAEAAGEAARIRGEALVDLLRDRGGEPSSRVVQSTASVHAGTGVGREGLAGLLGSARRVRRAGEEGGAGWHVSDGAGHRGSIHGCPSSELGGRRGRAGPRGGARRRGVSGMGACLTLSPGGSSSASRRAGGEAAAPVAKSPPLRQPASPPAHLQAPPRVVAPPLLRVGQRRVRLPHQLEPRLGRLALALARLCHIRNGGEARDRGSAPCWAGAQPTAPMPVRARPAALPAALPASGLPHQRARAAGARAQPTAGPPARVPRTRRPPPAALPPAPRARALSGCVRSAALRYARFSSSSPTLWSTPSTCGREEPARASPRVMLRPTQASELHSMWAVPEVAGEPAMHAARFGSTACGRRTALPGGQRGQPSPTSPHHQGSATTQPWPARAPRRVVVHARPPAPSHRAPQPAINPCPSAPRSSPRAALPAGPGIPAAQAHAGVPHSPRSSPRAAPF